MRYFSGIVAFVVVFTVAGAVWFVFRDESAAYSESGDPLKFIESKEEPEDMASLAQNAVPPTPAPSSVTTQSGSVIVTLNSQNNSNESGTATLTEADGRTTVTLNMVGAPVDVRQPAHIHSGSCSALGGVAYPLSPLENGKSTTTFDLTLDKLRQGLPLAINVHKSASEIDAYVACGDVKDVILPPTDGGPQPN